MDQENDTFFYFKASLENQYFVQFDFKNLTVGSEGDGPAFRLNNEMYHGSTNACLTFNSPILI
jgi:hypothetical protein